MSAPTLTVADLPFLGGAIVRTDDTVESAIGVPVGTDEAEVARLCLEHAATWRGLDHTGVLLEAPKRRRTTRGRTHYTFRISLA